MHLNEDDMRMRFCTAGHPTCKARSPSKADAGYNDAYRGWYDVQGCGKCNDYCRWVGNSGSGAHPKHGMKHGKS